MTLKYIKYEHFYKYTLIEDVKYKTIITGHNAEIKSKEPFPWVKITEDGTIKIRTDYSWDGPSGPAIDTKNFMKASLIHDALYQMIQEGQLPKSERKNADKMMRLVAREEGMGRFRAWYTYTAVRWFGGAYIKS